MNKKQAVEFLEEASNYFKNRVTNGEDKAYWANVYNSESCKKVIDILVEDEWQPIETAPKDGTLILTAETYRNYWNIEICHYNESQNYGKGGWMASEYDSEVPKLTHWMPLPEHPKNYGEEYD